MKPIKRSMLAKIRELRNSKIIVLEEDILNDSKITFILLGRKHIRSPRSVDITETGKVTIQQNPDGTI